MGAAGQDRPAVRDAYGAGIRTAAAPAAEIHERRRGAAAGREVRVRCEHEPAVAVAAADRLPTEDAVRTGTARLDLGRVEHTDVPGLGAIAAIAADIDADQRAVLATLEIHRDDRAAIATAATEALREDRVAGASLGEDHAGALARAPVGDRHVAGRLGLASLAADIDEQRRRRRVVIDHRRDAEIHQQAGIAAATADTLRADADRVAAERVDDAFVDDRDILADAAFAARAADIDVQRLLAHAAADRAADHHAAFAAAATDRLGVDAVRPAAAGDDRARIRDVHRARRSALAAAAADQGADVRAALLRVLLAQQLADQFRRRRSQLGLGDAGVAADPAAAADRLGVDAVGAVAERRDLRCAAHVDCTGRAAGATLAADADGDRVLHLQQLARDRAAHAAAAADALRMDRVGIGAARGDRAGSRHGDGTRAATRATFETPLRTDLERRVVLLAADGDRIRAADAATTADALRPQADGPVAERGQHALRRRDDRAALAARAAALAERDVDRALLARERIERDLRGHQVIADLRIVGLGVAAAAADALREDRGGVVAERDDRSLVRHRHHAAVTAVRRRAADHHVDAAATALRTRTDVDAGTAAAAADRLREDAVAAPALRRDVAHVRDVHGAAPARRAAGAADRDRQLLRLRILGLAIALDDEVHAGIAAAAADGLRREAVGVIAAGDQHAGRLEAALHRDGARVAGTIARAAHTGRERIALVGIDAGDVHAAVAAAAADALREDAVGTLAEFERLAFFGRHRGVGIGRLATVHVDGAIAGEHHRSGTGSGAALAADADRGGIALAARSVARDIESAIAAAAADALRQHADRIRAFDGHRALLHERDRAGAVAIARGAAEPEDQRRLRAFLRRLQTAADVDAAVAATAADRLRHHADRAIARGEDIGDHGRGDRTAEPALATEAADADRDLAVVGDAAADVDAAVAAAAAERLRTDGEAIVADRPHGRGVHGEGHGAGVAALRTEATNADVQRIRAAGLRRGERDAAADVEAAIAARAAEALREDAVGAVLALAARHAVHRDEVIGREAGGGDVAVHRCLDGARIATTVAEAAETEGAGERRALARARDRAGDVDAAVAAAAPDRLRDHAVGTRAGGGRGARPRQRDLGRVAAATAEATDADCAGSRAVRAQLHRAGDVDAAVAAATADALRQHADRIGAPGIHRAADTTVDRRRRAAVAAEAADTDRGRAARFLRERHAAGHIEAAVAAAAAHALEQHAVGAIARRARAARHRAADDAARAAIATEAADAHRQRARARLRGRDAAGHVESTAAAATADALHEHRMRLVAERGRDAAEGGRRGAAAAATAAGTADANRNRRGARETRRHAARH